MATKTDIQKQCLAEEFEALLWRVTRGLKNAGRIAEAIGLEANTFYRQTKPGSNADFKAKHLAPLLVATGNVKILHWMAARLGCLVIKVPRRKRGIKSAFESTAKLDKALLKASNAVRSFEEAGFDFDAVGAAEEIEHAMRLLASARERIEKNSGQTSLF